MGEIITEWITKRTGTCLDLDNKNLIDCIKDGKILAKIIYSYGIIDKNIYDSILPATDNEQALDNFQRLRTWLTSVNVDVDEQLINKIVHENSNSSAVKMFYQLYLAFTNKDTLHFIVNRFSKSNCPPTSRFKVEKVEERRDQNDTKDFVCQEFLKQEDVIAWQKAKYQTMLENFKEAREKYLLHLKKLADDEQKTSVPKTGEITKKEDDDLAEIQKLPIKIEKDISYGELVQQKKNIEELPPPTIDPGKANVIVNKIRAKRRHRDRQKTFQIQMQKLLLQELWDKIISQQEKEVNESLRAVLTKQARYERQMAMKLMDIREEQMQIIENKKKAQKKVQKTTESEITYTEFLEEKQSNDLIRSYYEEKARMLELHRKLYALKQCLKKERNWNICRDIVKDITDIAIRYGEYREIHETDVPQEMKNDMAELFIKEQSIFDLLDQPDDILQDYFMEEPSEVIHTYETIRMGYLDKKDFENYMNLEWPWDITQFYENYEDDIEKYETMFKTIEMGMNVLGHIVHWLSKSLCEQSGPAQPPNIIKAQPAACVVGISDAQKTVPLLKKILKQRKIEVIEVQDVIDFCLNAYKEESVFEHLDNIISEETNLGLEQKAGEMPKTLKKGEKPVKSNAKKDKIEANQNTNNMNDEKPTTSTKGLQTPKIFPCERLQLSKKAELGLITQQMLSLGEPISEKILADMLIEYLKTLKDIQGWVIINYPIDYEEAVTFEEALTAIPVPDKNKTDLSEQSEQLDDFADLERRFTREQSCTKDWRSRIVPKPLRPIEDYFYQTYLTAFIKVIKMEELEEEQFDEDDPFGENKMTNIEAFYSKQGCYYTLTYKILDFPTVKNLARLIIGEFSLPPKTSVEIFGETILYIQDELKAAVSLNAGGKAQKKGEKEKKPPKVVKQPPPKSEKDSTKDKKQKDAKKDKKQPDAVIKAVAMEDKEIQVPEIEPEVIIIYEEPPPPPKPGEFEWNYVDIEFPLKLKVALATLWSNAEVVYVGDFEQLFFFQRMIINAVWPFLTFIRSNFRGFMSRPDNKQIHLYRFQQIFNAFDQDAREDDEVKAELHCRIAEFREKLLEICENRMLECEEERRNAMMNYWEGMEICELGNIYINFIQLEIDRCADTMFLLTDYYTAVISQMPFEEPFPPKDVLDKIDLGNHEAPSEIVLNLYNFLQRDRNFLPKQQTNPVFDIINERWSRAGEIVKKYDSYSREAMFKMTGFFKKKGDKSKDKGNPKQGKSNTAKKEGGGKLPKFTEPSEEVISASDRIMQEWAAALDAEILRVNFRLSLILETAKRKINSYINNSNDFFNGLYNEIAEKYKKEIDTVEKACELFARAVEAETPIQPLLHFKGDQFYIDTTNVLFPDALPEPEPPLQEKTFKTVFKASQVKKFVDIMFDMAPDGIIPERTFLYILQDAICLNAEDGKEPMVPDQWKELRPEQVEELTKEVFGTSEFVNWKDFIIRSLNIPFPSEEDLLEIRATFREHDPDMTENVKDYQFYSTPLWFEYEVDPEDREDMLRLHLIKDLLFRLYRINEDTLNYTALLLAFCKDLNPVCGVAKALALSLGKMVCWDRQTGDKFLEKLVEKKKEKEDVLEKVKSAAESLVDELIDHTVHVCDSVVIEELVSETTEQFESITTLSGEDEEARGSTYCSYLFNKEFSNTEIGAESTKLPNLVYILPFEPILTVMSAAMPWYAKVQNLENESLRQKLEKIYESVKREELNFSVLTHEFLNSEMFHNLLPSISSQFSSVQTGNIVQSLLEQS